MKTKLILILAVIAAASIFSGCASTDSNPNDFQLLVSESYGPVKHESELRMPQDQTSEGMTVRVFAQQGDVGQREDFQTVEAGPRTVSPKGVSDAAELEVFAKEHLAYEVVLHKPSLVNQEAIAIANNELNKALAAENTQQIKAWGEILSSLTEAALTAAGKTVVPLP